MSRTGLWVIVLIVALVSGGWAQDAVAKERPDWDQYFDKYDALGTIVIRDERGGDAQTHVYNMARAETRYSPASTFKIPHALFALEAGAIRDEFEVIAWDGETRWLEAWNRDQDLRSSMRNSVVWVYEGFARKIGEAREKEYLARANYGNQDTSGGLETFWLDGSLRINAHEQVAFLRALYRNELPFELEHQRLVKDIMIVEAGKTYILRAKTGWEGSMGWWVGWVEWPEGPVFFALNIDTPNRMEDVYKREAIAREVLVSIRALPTGE